MKRLRVVVLALGVLCACTPPETETAEPAPAPERVAAALTVYNSGRALVKDTRTFDLEQGMNTVRFDDVTSGIIPGSVHVETTDGGNVAVWEQNFEYDLVSTQKLLQRYLGQQIQVTTESGDLYSGTLLSGAGDVILKGSGGGVVVLKYDQVRDFEFPELPEGLASRPSLLWSLEAEQGGDQDLTVTYLSGGFGWSSDYIVQLSDADDQVDLSGWVSVNNYSEATFDDARLKLVAGDVFMVSGNAEVAGLLAEVVATGNGYGGGGHMPVERSFFDYHLYEMPHPVTLRSQENKQVEFVDRSAIPSEVTYKMQFDGYWYGTTVTRHPSVTVEFVNGEEQGLGVPLPAGVVRVYKADIDGAAELVGESNIQHTPKDETIRLTVGEAFDIVGEWKQTKHRVISDWVNRYSYEVVVRNHKEEEVTVTLSHMPYHWGEWKVTQCSTEHRRPDNATLEIDVVVPPGGETTVTYTVQSRW